MCERPNDRFSLGPHHVVFAVLDANLFGLRNGRFGFRLKSEVEAAGYDGRVEAALVPTHQKGLNGSICTHKVAHTKKTKKPST